MKPPKLVAFDAINRTLTFQFDHPVIDQGFYLGQEFPLLAIRRNGLMTND